MKKILSFFWILVFFCVACSSSSSKESKDLKSEEIIPVQVIRLKKEPMRTEIETVGTIYPQKEIGIIPKVAGRIEKVYVKEGDRVKSGALLAKIDQTDFLLAVNQAEAALATTQANLSNLLAGTRVEKIEQAKAAFQQAQANLTNAEKEYQRNKRLTEIGAVAQRQLDAASAQYESNLSMVKQAQEQLGMLQKGPTREEIEIVQAQVRQAEAGVAIAKNSLKETLLKAPFSGIITARYTDEGGQVYPAPKADILKLSDLSRVKIETSISERDFSKLKIGTPAEIRVDALPGEIFQGQVTRVIPEINPQSRNFNVELEIPNLQLRLKGGMFASIRLFTGKKETLVISRETLITDEVSGIHYAFVVEGNQAVRRKLTLGERSGLFIEVLEGLQEGENLVIKGQTRLQPKSKVRMIQENSGVAQ